MKIRRLKLENYRRHRQTELEFPDGVTALLGRNGAGKSTLLEGIGFALFGTPATRTSKDLLRHADAAATDAVRVELDVELAGSAYRIVRELKGKNLTPNASLEQDGIVQIAPGAKSGDAVTKHMEGVLGMQRDGFFTTIVARQKELSRLADESPADRKRLILELLGVEQVDRAIHAARRNRNTLRTEVDTMRGLLPDKKEVATAVTSAKEALAGATRDADAAQKAWDAAKDQLTQAHHAAQEASRARQAHEQAKAAVAQADREAQLAAQRVQEIAAEIEAAEEAQEKAEALAPVANRWEDAKRAVEQAMTAAHAAKEYAQAKQQRDAQQAAVASAQARLGPEPDIPSGLEEAEAKAAKLEAAHRSLDEQVAVAAARVKELRERHRRMQALGDDADCPTCEQPLADHLPKVLADLEREFQEARTAHEEAKKASDAAHAEARVAHEAATALAKQVAQATQAAAERKIRAEQLAAEKARLEAMRLPAAPGPVPELAPLQAALAEAEEAAKQLALLRGKAEVLENARMRHQAAVTASQVKVDALLEAERALQPEDKAWDVATQRHAEAQAAERDAERTVLAARQAIALAEKDLEKAQDAVARREALHAKLKEAEDDLRLWTALAGKAQDGLLDRFKLHLIQRAGPAIAEEASRLLAQFTGGRYTEVLLDDDYKIFVTEDGVPYTLDRFSGGEADLVHLALRLAVSRLLADRSGAELRFLALDEVFGSLDAERRDLVVGALQELGGLYSQVLLVTHLDSLRDALDQSILVEERDGEAIVTVHTG